MTDIREQLSAPLDIGFDYTRSLGSVRERFATDLQQGRITGVRGSDGRVHVPAIEHDPRTAEPLSECVPVSDHGVVETWCWTPEPRPGQPLDHPFAWAMVRLDGADTPMLSAIDVRSPEQVRTGMRVRVRWSPNPSGSIDDIARFEPVPDESTPERATRPPQGNTSQHDSELPAKTADEQSADVPTPHLTADSTLITPVRLSYRHTASPEETRYLRGLAQGRLLGQRCPACRKVYIPPRGACPTDGIPTTDEVELDDAGTVTTFCVVNVPFLGQQITPPYVAASIVVDGADIPFGHLVLGCAADEVRMGMRVQASWQPQDKWSHSLANIAHFEPTGEPDADYHSYAHHL